MGNRETRVWLVRHAETATPHLFHGAESDVGLSALGERQAAEAADWFRSLEPTAVVSSAMLRAVRSAAPIAAVCRISHHIEPEFHERKVGSLSGTSFTPATGPWADTIRRWQAGDTSYTTPGAESFDDLRARLEPAFDRAVAAHAGGRVVVVAHGVVCKVLLLSRVPGLTVADWVSMGKVRNLAVSELVGTPGGGWRVESLLVVPESVRALVGDPRGSAA
jgi:broad specificity phosphatase PhoE